MCSGSLNPLEIVTQESQARDNLPGLVIVTLPPTFLSSSPADSPRGENVGDSQTL